VGTKFKTLYPKVSGNEIKKVRKKDTFPGIRYKQTCGCFRLFVILLKINWDLWPSCSRFTLINKQLFRFWRTPNTVTCIIIIAPVLHRHKKQKIIRPSPLQPIAEKESSSCLKTRFRQSVVLRLFLNNSWGLPNS
jgi:hypothetical protein